MATRFTILAWKIPMDRGAWQATVHGVKESDMTEQLSSSSGMLTLRKTTLELSEYVRLG